MSTPPVSASSRPASVAALDQSCDGRRDPLDRRLAATRASRRMRWRAPARSPGSPANVDSTITVSPSAGRAATSSSPSQPQLGRLAGDAGAQPRRQAGGDVGRDNAGSEQRGVGLAGMRLQRVDQRLRQPVGERGVVGDQHLRGAVGAEPGSPAVVEALAGHEGDRLAAQRGGHQDAQAVRRELAVVVVDVYERPHLDHAPLGQKLDDRGHRVAAGVLEPATRLLGRRRRHRPHHRPRAGLAHLRASMPASAAESVSSGFFLAPMIALIEGSRAC